MWSDPCPGKIITSGQDRIEFQDVTGFFANTMVPRCDLSDNSSVIDAVTRLRVETESVFDREVSFADMALSRERRSPTFP